MEHMIFVFNVDKYDAKIREKLPGYMVMQGELDHLTDREPKSSVPRRNDLDQILLQALSVGLRSHL